MPKSPEERVSGALLTSMSHKLRNPLYTLSMTIELLNEARLGGQGDLARDEAAFARAERALARIRAALDELDEVAHFVTGYGTMALRPERVADLMEAVRVLSEERALPAQYEIAFDSEERVRAHTSSFARALVHLVEGIAWSSGSPVSVRATPQDSGIVFSLSTSSGGAVDGHASWFDEVGLFIARSLLKGHGATWQVPSGDERAVFTLPRLRDEQCDRASGSVT